MAERGATVAMGEKVASGSRPVVDAPFGNALVALARGRPDIVGLSADLAKYTDILPFRDAFPDRFFNVGMAEQNLIAVSAGLAKSGFKAFCTTYGVFATRRAYDFVAIACAHSRADVKIFAGLPGLTTGYGGTHQAIEDLALMRMIPDLVVIDPCDATEIEQVVEAVAAHPGPAYVRLLRGLVPRVLDPARHQFEIGRGYVLRSEGGLGLISTGLMTERALDAAAELAARGIATSAPPHADDQAFRCARGRGLREGRHADHDAREPRGFRWPRHARRRGALRLRNLATDGPRRHSRPVR